MQEKDRVREADAEICLAQAEVERARTLWNEAVGSRHAVDRPERDVETARAQEPTPLKLGQRVEIRIEP